MRSIAYLWWWNPCEKRKKENTLMGREKIKPTQMNDVHRLVPGLPILLATLVRS
jgi:hypothetical protein